MSLLEITIAFAILFSTLSGMILLVYLDQQWLMTEPIRLTALSRIDTIISYERQLAQNNFDAVVASTSIEDIYIEKIEVSLIKNDLKKIIVTLSWPPRGYLRGGQLSETATVADWSAELQNPTCHIGQTNNQFSSFVLQSSQLLSTSTTITDIEARHNILYITADSATKSKNDFYIIDASDTKHPKILLQIDTGPGLEALALHDNYAYVANASVNGQLQIIDVSDTNHPILKKTYKLPGVYSDSGSVGNSIYYHQGFVYLGLKKSSAPELHVIDVSDPLNPKEVGQWEANTTIHSIIANNNIVYIASPDDAELILLDSHDLSNINKISSWNAPGSSGNGKSLYQDGQTIYLGRTLGNGEFSILDVASSTEIKSLLTLSLKTSVEDILIASTTAFLATLDTAKQFQVWNVTDKARPILESSIKLAASPVALACDGQTIYIATK